MTYCWSKPLLYQKLKKKLNNNNRLKYSTLFGTQTSLVISKLKL